MGNNSSSWFSIKTSKEEEEEKKKLKASLTEYDNTMNTIKRENMFKGTIIICIVYAIFGFLLLLLSYFSDSIRDLLFNKFLAFTLVYIIGSIVIIFIMLYYIYTFEPVKINRYNEIDDISCPDYWEVEIIDDNYIGDSFDPNYASEFKYRCVLNDEIFDKANMFKYHNLNNYRMTNNIGRTKSDPDLIGAYNINVDTDFNSNYKNNGKKYNLYVDVNKFKANHEDSSYTKLNAKKELSKQLNIYNDSNRIDNILTNLKNIALLENNYQINTSNKSANNLLTTSNILNPKGNFGIWQKSNTGIGSTEYLKLSSTEGDNNLLLINWNGLDYTYLSNILNETNITSIKVVSDSAHITNEQTPPGGGTTQICLGMIKYKSQTDKKIYFEPYFATGLLKLIFTANGTTVAIIDSNNTDPKNNIITKTRLYKTTLSTTQNKSTYTGTTSGTGVTLASDTFINKAGPILQAYNKTNYRPDSYAADNINTSYQVPLLCDAIYPKLFARFEKEDTKNENHNDIRCAYSKICGIPWSDLRCPSN
jgi:hypothetical protein